MSTVARMTLSHMILGQLGIKPDLAHVGSRRALVAWMGPESSWTAPCDGVHGARFNPLNTILVVDGGTQKNKYNENPGVKNYTSALFGAEAVAQTLVEGQFSHNYKPIIDALAKPGSKVVDILFRVAESDWGTFKKEVGGAKFPDYTYAKSIADTYNFSRSQRNRFNAVLVGP